MPTTARPHRRGTHGRIGRPDVGFDAVVDTGGPTASGTCAVRSKGSQSSPVTPYPSYLSLTLLLVLLLMTTMMLMMLTMVLLLLGGSSSIAL